MDIGTIAVELVKQVPAVAALIWLVVYLFSDNKQEKEFLRTERSQQIQAIETHIGDVKREIIDIKTQIGRGETFDRELERKLQSIEVTLGKIEMAIWQSVDGISDLRGMSSSSGNRARRGWPASTLMFNSDGSATPQVNPPSPPTNTPSPAPTPAPQGDPNNP